VKKEYINMSNSHLDDVFKIDQLLHQLASYEVTGGKMVVPSSFEEVYELNKKTADKFNYFKMLIQKGECSIDFIKERVLRKNGPFPKEVPISVDNPELLEKILDWQKEEEKEEKDRETNFINGLIKLFSDDMSESERNNFVKDMGLKSVKIKIPLPPEPKKLPEKNKTKIPKIKKPKPPKKS